MEIGGPTIILQFCNILNLYTSFYNQLFCKPYLHTPFVSSISTKVHIFIFTTFGPLAAGAELHYIAPLHSGKVIPLIHISLYWWWWWYAAFCLWAAACWQGTLMKHRCTIAKDSNVKNKLQRKELQFSDAAAAATYYKYISTRPFF